MIKKIFLILILFTAVILSATLFACRDTYDREIGMIDRSQLNIIRENEAIAGDIRWQLLKAEDIGPSFEGEFGTLESIQGKFIYIEFTVENSGQDTKQILDLKAIDSKGRIYSICNETYGYFDGPSACTLQDINPETKQTFAASFDVPLDSAELVLEVTDLNTPPRERAYIDIGL